MKRKIRTFGNKAYHYGVQLVAVGGLTGLLAGLVVTLYSAVASLAEEFARGYYGFFRDRPAFIPLLFLALFVGAIVVGGAMKFVPMIRGGGIPQTEGATRGLIRYKWYQVLTGMFAASLFTIFMGLSADGEGPSVQIGGAVGYGVSDVLRRNAVVRRYQITGGACAGLAVASNAPLTGMAFAFEEAHKQFTPEVFICSFSSVVVAVITRNALRGAMNLPVGPLFSSYDFSGLSAFDFSFLLYVLPSAAVCGLVGVAFYYLVLRSKKLFSKLNLWKGFFKPVIPFLLAGVCGLITAYAMGGGHAFIESLGTMEHMTTAFSTPLWATLVIVVALKLVVTVVNLGAGVPCGVFIPMLALGAGIGGLMSLLCGLMGMDSACADALILICMAAFFTTVVKAPITGIVMVLEFTWSFTFLLPVILGVAVGYLIGDAFRTEPIYDKLLDDILEETRGKAGKISVSVRVDTRAAGRAVRDILWPFTALVTEIARAGEKVVPQGDTELAAGDILTVEGTPDNPEEFLSALESAVGEIAPRGAPPDKEPAET